MPRPIHFEIYADDPERAARFYTDVFGWEIKKWDGPMDYWMVMTGEKSTPGINGGLLKRPKPIKDPDSVTAYPCTIDVDDIDAYIEKVQQAGGAIIMPKDEVPSVGLLATCRDTEGNMFGLIQPSMSMGS